MTRSLSRFLDAARFISALLVVFAHVDETWLPGSMPFLTHFGLEAVGVFFVLSGFVIGYATDTRERSGKAYLINRAARLYSVVVPCLLIVLVTDILTLTHNPTFNSRMLPSYDRVDADVASVVFSLTFLNSLWSLNIAAGSDAPFWSLGFEVAFYAVYGSAVFASGYWRVIAPVALGLVAGPRIMCLFPLWLLGFAAYRFCRSGNIGRAHARTMLVICLTVYVLSEVTRWRTGIAWSKPTCFMTDDVIQLYGSGLLFLMAVVAFRYSALPFDGAMAAIWRWLAGSTFTLYLLHWPIDRVLTAMLPETWSEPLRWTVLVSAAVVGALFVAEFSERRKEGWRRAIEGMAGRMERGLWSLQTSRAR